jgi:hypothetical protein
VHVPGLHDIEVVQQGDQWNYSDAKQSGEDNDNVEVDDDDDDDEKAQRTADQQQQQQQQQSTEESRENDVDPSRRCDLLWTGLLPKRMFTGFKFQETKSSGGAKKLLEGKNASHYWDMVEHADALVVEANDDDWSSLF